jgi:hypothetical protein
MESVIWRCGEITGKCHLEMLGDYWKVSSGDAGGLMGIVIWRCWGITGNCHLEMLGDYSKVSSGDAGGLLESVILFNRYWLELGLIPP